MRLFNVQIPWRPLFISLFGLALSMQAHAGWQMTFNDEFDGGQLNTAKWNTSYFWFPTVINGEEQYYNPAAIGGNFEMSKNSAGDSILRIRADKKSMQGQPYTSGSITTLGKFSQTYGRFEMRAKLPKGKGLWPAFWLMPDSKTWPPEIDIMENVGHAPNEVAMTYHYGQDPNHPYSQSFYKGADFSAGYHTFAIEWSKGLLVWYVDGVERHRFANSGVAAQSFYVILNLAVGGGWPGSPDSNTQFPAYYDIDYVRAYKWVDGNTSPTPPPATPTPKPSTPTPTPVPPPTATTKSLVARHSGQCVDVAGDSTANGASVIQYKCVSSDNQRFEFVSMGNNQYSLKAKHSGKCLDIPSSSKADGVGVIQYDCHGRTNQMFTVKNMGGGYSSLVNVNSGKCLDISGASKASEAKVIQYRCTGAQNQQFQLK